MGARPVFCEIDPERLVIDPADMERRITPRTKAVSIVHLYGNVCDMDAIMAIARKHKIAVIEDCSHCHGAEWEGKKLGTIGDIGCFSMQGGPIGGKPVPGGEAGLCITANRDMFERMLLFGQLNRAGLMEDLTNPEYRAFAPTNLGLKFRAHPFALGIGLIMMESLDERNAKRFAYRQKIYDGLAGVPGVKALKSYTKAKPAGFYGGMHMMYHPEELGGLKVERFIEAMQAEGVNMSPPRLRADAPPQALRRRVRHLRQGQRAAGGRLPRLPRGQPAGKRGGAWAHPGHARLHRGNVRLLRPAARRVPQGDERLLTATVTGGT